MELTANERQQLDNAATAVAVFVIRRPVHTPNVVEEFNGFDMLTTSATYEEYAWRWNAEAMTWEYYGDPGSTAPTDVYAPQLTARQAQMAELRRVRAMAAQDYAITPTDEYLTGNEPRLTHTGTGGIGQPIGTVGVDTGNGTWVHMPDAQFSYTTTWGDGIALGNTAGTWEGITLQNAIPRRGNNYDIVHKATSE